MRPRLAVLVLAVGLQRPGTYALGDRPLPASAETIDRAVRVCAAAAGLVVAVALMVAWLREGRS